ncbi:MAG: hypothetical protein HYZ14_12330 [Bacteroidetes bacterium]|nr:hypothetical protein [Bacteroidota bacterium]
MIPYYRLIKNASVFALAFCFYSTYTTGQTSNQNPLVKEVRNSCEPPEGIFMDLNNPEWNYIWYQPLDSTFRSEIKKVRFKSENLKTSKGFSDFLTIAAPKETGNAKLSVKVITKNKSKFIFVKNYTVVELPELTVEIAVTDPASKFMWLNLIETGTGQNVTGSFNLCKIEFELAGKDGKIKEYGISCKGDEFFPSVTLHNLPSLFELNDILRLNMVVMHHEYDLPVYIQKELIIENLWN